MQAEARQTICPTVSPGRLLQRKCACGGTAGPSGECAECRKKKLQRKAAQPPARESQSLEIPPIVHEVLQSSGRPLDAGTREFMGSRFQHDFSGVRVHSGARAAESARAVNAQAYTVGRDIVFADAQYAPDTRAGQRLLAHELTHVVQQSGVGENSAATQIAPAASPLEREAESAAKTATDRSLGNGFTPTVSGPRLMRQVPVGTTPTGGGGWGSNLLTIILASDRQNCFGAADESGVDLYSNCGSPERGKFCQSISVPYEVSFYLDRANAPRPRPFSMPTVRAAFDFVTSSGQQGHKSDQTDTNPKYTKPNDPLTPSFGRKFSIGSAESGTLKVLLELKDSDSGVNLKFSDKIRFEVIPCT